MKNLIILLICSLLCVSISCEKAKDKPESANTDIVSKITDPYLISKWENGLIDHAHENFTNSLPPVYYYNIEALRYSTSTVSNNAMHHTIYKDVKKEPFKTIYENQKFIDGIILGKVATGSSFSYSETFIISLVITDLIKVSATCQKEYLKFFKDLKGQNIYFKCTDKAAGTWIQASQTDALIVKYLANKSGLYIGKNNFINTIYQKNTGVMYFYMGYDSKNNLEFVAVDKPYFTPLPVVGPGGSALPSAPKSPFYMSSLNGISIFSDCIGAIGTNHSTLRRCPQACPE